MPVSGSGHPGSHPILCGIQKEADEQCESHGKWAADLGCGGLVLPGYFRDEALSPQSPKPARGRCPSKGMEKKKNKKQKPADWGNHPLLQKCGGWVCVCVCLCVCWGEGSWMPLYKAPGIFQVSRKDCSLMLITQQHQQQPRSQGQRDTKEILFSSIQSLQITPPSRPLFPQPEEGTKTKQ